MNYASIRKQDISNGEGIGIALFVQGCPNHCPGCFNQETWDFSGGKPWTEEVRKYFIQLANKPYIKRISLLGGEPFAPQNFKEISDLIITLKTTYKDKKIWLYTGYKLESFKNESIISMIDVIVDGPYIESLRNPSLAFRGSSNQRIFDIINGQPVERILP